jgi:AAA domain-containing protein
MFRRISELDEGEVPMLIEGILPAEGVTFIGSLSGVGKTWVALSMAKALRTGKPLFGHYRVPVTVPVVYLVPEMGSRTIRRRIEKLEIPDSDQFLLRTLKEGVMHLDSPYLKDMIQELKPVLFLDTAIRFIGGADENNASENSTGLAEAIFTLLRLGAKAVVCLHHSPKNFAKERYMTLETALRGTGDFGAICEVVWGIRHARRWSGKNEDKPYAKESLVLTRLELECLKGRDIPDVADPFMIQGRPYIDERGDFAILRRGDLDTDPTAANADRRLQTLVDKITEDKTVSIRTLTALTGWNNAAVKAHAESRGYRQVAGNGWIKGEPEKTIPDVP